ncbi:MAG: tRNA lysidine(34) synthetase TilS, partial [Deferrisomatales bacterium]
MVSTGELVRGALADAGLLDQRLLVALSGGVDSVCLLRLLAAVAGGGFEVAHVDHGLRPGSGADARFCAELARELGAPFHLLRLEAGVLRGGGGLQAEARQVRRRFFEETRERRGLGAVALGHHADDQVETVLYRLVRGAGPRGLGGMEAWSPPYLRPLLGVRRAELEALAAAQGWSCREDPTNREPRYARNRLRLVVVPALRQVHPGAEQAILRCARLAAEDDRVLSGLARAALAEAGWPEPEGVRVPVAALRALEAPIRRRLFLAAWQAVGCPPA